MIKVTDYDKFVSNSGRAVNLTPEGKIPTLAIEWNLAEELFWTLRLCERFGISAAQWGYPPRAEWMSERQNQLSYYNLTASAEDSFACYSSAKVEWADENLNFQIKMHNHSGRVLSDAWCWVCLIHLWAGAFQANCQLPVGSGEEKWMHSAALEAPKERWLKWCPIQQHRKIAEKIARHNEHMWQPHIVAKESAVHAWRINAGRKTQQFIELASPDGIILGWSHWPCTDMGLYFGSIEPDNTATVEGHLRFYEKSYIPI